MPDRSDEGGQCGSEECVWDEVNGVWKGAVIPGSSSVDVPDPLWIYGYGSLLWKPQAGWEDYEHCLAKVKGYKRLFAQLSTDHRGTPSFPGLVVTLVSDRDLEELGARDPYAPPSETLGVIYKIPKDEAAAILEDLDFREKGGYSRDVVDVIVAPDRRTSTALPEGANLKALLYAGKVDNPNFRLCADLNQIASTIQAAHGPSGSNREYLYRLADFLREAGHYDEHIMNLDESVKSLDESLTFSSGTASVAASSSSPSKASS